MLTGCVSWEKSKFKYQKTIDNFTFYYNSLDQNANIEFISQQKGSFDALVTKYLPRRDRSEKINIFLKDSKLAKEDKILATGVSGYYNGNIVMRTDSCTIQYQDMKPIVLDPPDPIDTIYHEYTHHLTQEYDFPRWVSEGLATFMASQLTKDLKKSNSPLAQELTLDVISKDRSWEKYPGNLLYNCSAIYVKNLIAYIGPQKFKETLLNTKKGDIFEVSLEKVTRKSYYDIINSIENEK